MTAETTIPRTNACSLSPGPEHRSPPGMLTEAAS